MKKSTSIFRVGLVVFGLLAAVALAIDTDTDGMPDGWEVDNGLDPQTNDAALDPDGDSLTNLQEYETGTDPQDSDSDDDGMPDGWEVDNGLNPLPNDADADNDRHSNYKELVAGTDPTNPEDVLKMVDISRNGTNSGVNVTWTAKPGQSYDVETTTNLVSGSWSELAGATNLATTNEEVTITAPATNKFCGYRIKVNDQEVYSRSHVGYARQRLLPGFSLVRMPFVQEDLSAVNIQDIFDPSALNQGSNAGLADSIQFWDPIESKYDAYFLHDGTAGKLLVPEKKGKWVDSSTGLIASNAVAPGRAFFFVRAGTNDVEVLVSGTIVDPATGMLELLEGFNMVAYPFSSEFKPNEGGVNWTNLGVKAGAFAGIADSLRFWDPIGSKYDRYFVHDGTAGKLLVPEKKGKWVDSSTGLIASNLTAGVLDGFFYSRVIGQSNLTLEVVSPYTLYGVDPQTNDAGDDADADGLTNLEEYNAGTDPQNPDTDNDTIQDGDDAFPLDPQDSDTHQRRLRRREAEYPCNHYRRNHQWRLSQRTPLLPWRP